MTIDLYNQLKTIPGCFRLLNAYRYHLDYSSVAAANVLTQSECFSAIPVKDIDLLLKMTREGEEMGASEVYIKNSRIVVHAGPLKGLEGLIKKFNKRQKRVKVSLNFMGNVKEVDMDVELLSTLDKTIC